MNVIDEIKDRLSKYENAKYESDASSISVLPSSDMGFTVTLNVNHRGYTVFFNGWHEEFENENEALNCLALGLSDECRLKEYRRGRFAYKWTVETREDEEWVEHATTGLFLFPFWKHATVHYLQNNLLSSRQGQSTSDEFWRVRSNL